MRAKYHTTMSPLWRAGRALASAACALLSPRFAASTPYLSAGLSRVGALASVGLLPKHRLLYNRHIGRYAKDGVLQLYLPDFFARYVMYCCLHIFLQELRVRVGFSLLIPDF